MNKRKEIIGFTILFGLSVFYLYFVKLGIGPISTDETMGVIIGSDILNNGNFLMTGWNMSTGITTIQLLWATAICNIFGYSYTTLYIISALNYAILIGVLAYIAAFNSNTKTYNKCLISVFVIFLTINPKSASMLNVCTHTLNYAICFLAVYIVYKMSIKLSKLILYIMTGIVIGLIASVNVTLLYYACVSITALGVMYLLLKLGNKRQSCYIIICGSISVVVRQIALKIWEMSREKEATVGLRETFVDKENIVNNIVQVISNILYEFGIDVWGKNLISIDTLKAVIGFIAIVCIIKVLMQYTKLDENKKMLVIAVMSIGIINLLAYGISSVPSYSASSHLMELFGLSLVCAAGICLGNIEFEETIRVDRRMLLVFVVIFFIFNIPKLDVKQAESNTYEITKYLQSNGYMKGFATYWETGNIMFESSMQMEIAPIKRNFDIIDGWEWTTKDEWLHQEGQFVVIRNGDPKGVIAQEFIDMYGTPSNQFYLNNYTVLLYDQGVTLKGSTR